MSYTIILLYYVPDISLNSHLMEDKTSHYKRDKIIINYNNNKIIINNLEGVSHDDRGKSALNVSKI